MKKKRIIAGIIGLALVAGTVGTLTSCGEENKPTPVVETSLTGIEVTATNEKVEKGATYTRSSAVKVTAKYSDNTTKDVTDKATFSAVDTATVGKKTVTVTYEGKTTTYTVEVFEAEAQILALEITKTGNTTFTFGDDFTAEGIEVTATLDDGTEKVLAASEYKVSLRAQDSTTSAEVTNDQFKAVTTKTTYYVYVVSNADAEVSARYEVVVDEAKTLIKNVFDVDSICTIEDGSSSKDEHTSDLNLAEFSTGTTLKLLATSAKKITASANKKTFHTTAFGDISTNHRIGLEGAAETAEETDPTKFTYRVIILDLKNDATVGIGALSSNTTDKRAMKISNGTDYTKSFVVDGAVDANTIDDNFFTVELKAGKYYIYCGVTDEATGVKAGGLNIHTVVVEEAVSAAGVTYSGLEVDTTKATLNYNVGDTFTAEGIVAKVQSNLGKVTLEPTDVTYEIGGVAAGTLTTAGTIEVTVKFGELSTKFNISVSAVDAVLSTLEVKTEPKLSYNKGDALDLSALKLTAKTHSASLNQDFVLVDDLTSTSEGVTAKVFDGETEVTDFTALNNGVYTLKLTYTVGEITVTAEKTIKVFEAQGAVAGSTGPTYKDYLVGETAVVGGCSLKLSYTDGVEADNYTKDITTGISLKVFSDEACTIEVTGAFETAGTYYVKVAKDTFVSTETFTITVRANTTKAKWTSTGAEIKSGVDLTTSDATILSGKTSGDKKFSADSSTTSNKYEKESKTVVTFKNESAETITLLLVVNGNGGSKKLEYKVGTNEQQVFNMNKSAGKYTLVITLAAGESVVTSSTTGGVLLSKVIAL